MCSCAVNQLQMRDTRGLLTRVGPSLHNDGARHRGNIRTRTPALLYRPRRRPRLRLTTMPLQPTRQCDGSGKAPLFRRLGIAAEPAAAVGSSSCLGGGPIARRESSPPAAIGCAEQLPGRLIRVQPGEHRLRQVDMVSSPAKQSSGRGQFRVRKPGLRRRRGS